MSQVKQIVSNSKKAAMCCIFGEIHCITHCKTKCALANAQKSKAEDCNGTRYHEISSAYFANIQKLHAFNKGTLLAPLHEQILKRWQQNECFHSIFSLLNKWLQCWIPSLLLGLWLFLLQVPAKIKLWHQHFLCASFNIIKKINRTGTRTQKKLSKENS